MTVTWEVWELAVAGAGLTVRGLAWAREERGRHLRWDGLWMLCVWGGRGRERATGRGGWEGASGQKAAALLHSPPLWAMGAIKRGVLSKERTFPKGCFETVADEGACPTPPCSQNVEGEPRESELEDGVLLLFTFPRGLATFCLCPVSYL